MGMIALLPAPQEMDFSTEAFELPARAEVVVSPWQGDDALEEVLLRALEAARCDARIRTAPLAGTASALVIARRRSDVAALAREAAKGLDGPLATRVVHTDGPYMASETSLQRRMPQPEGRDRSDEAYFLRVGARGIALAARSRRGLFWGVHTLRQLLESARGRAPRGLTIRDWPTQAVRGIHLDMKAFYQKPDAVEDWLKGLAALKLNAVLFEYEDKFPYERHRFLRAPSALTPAQLRRLLHTARRHHVAVIPLIQSLGHLEYCLKHDELAPLREAPDIYTQACPTNPDALAFVCDMMDEVMAAHREAELFHIGGDETGFLGHCPRCRSAMAKSDDVALYLRHITKVLQHVIGRGKRPILWDDIVRTRPERVARIPRETVLCYWDYGPRREMHGPRRLPAALERFYRTKGKRPALWPDTLSIFPYFDFYRQKGFDVLAAPCLNYGTLAPNLEHNAGNTMRFAEKAATCGGLGTINTQWACFRIPFGLGWHGYALTAESTWLNPPADVSDFDLRFSRALLGMGNGSLVAANRMVAEGVAFRAEGAARPFNVLHYAVMDAELHHEDGMEGRRRGAAARTGIDLVKVARRKFDLLKVPENRAQVEWRLDDVEAQMAEALGLLRTARPASARGRLMRDLLAASAEFKRARIRAVRLLLGADGLRFRSEREALAAERRVRRDLERLYARTLHRLELAGEMDLLFAGERALLEGRDAG